MSMIIFFQFFYFLWREKNDNENEGKQEEEGKKALLYCQMIQLKNEWKIKK